MQEQPTKRADGGRQTVRSPRAVPPPATDESGWADRPNWLRGFDLGLVAGIAAAAVYGIAAEPLGLTWGLIAVALGGGFVIGAAISRGAWGTRTHITVRRLRVMAVAMALGAWIVGLFVAYVLSQALFPEATTPLTERISFAGFSDYFAGLFDQIRFIHAASLAAMAFMAWRGTR